MQLKSKRLVGNSLSLGMSNYAEDALEAQFKLFNLSDEYSTRHPRKTSLSYLDPTIITFARNGLSFGVGENALTHGHRSSAYLYYTSVQHIIEQDYNIILNLGTNNMRADWIPICQKHILNLMGKKLKFSATETLLEIGINTTQDNIAVAKSYLNARDKLGLSLSQAMTTLQQMCDASYISGYCNYQSFDKRFEKILLDYFSHQHCSDTMQLSMQLSLIGMASVQDALMENLTRFHRMVLHKSNLKILGGLENSKFDLSARVKQLAHICNSEAIFDEELQSVYAALVLQVIIHQNPKAILRDGDINLLIKKIESFPYVEQLLHFESAYDMVQSWLQHFRWFFNTSHKLLFIVPYMPCGQFFGLLPNDPQIVKANYRALHNNIVLMSKMFDDVSVVSLEKHKDLIRQCLQNVGEETMFVDPQNDGIHLTATATEITNRFVCLVAQNVMDHQKLPMEGIEATMLNQYRSSKGVLTYFF